MTILQALILGIVQGITELLPISSSAHLNVIPWICKWTEDPAFNEMFEGAFDVALHAGTLLAVTIFFFKDWINLIVSGCKKVVKKEDSLEGRMFWQLVFATIPAGVLALVLDKISEKIIGDNFKLEMGIIAAMLMIMGVILYIVDKKAESLVPYEDINMKQSIVIGVSQALAAAFPGVSRSGITMTFARLFKIDRESAAKFSFLLSTPIVAAAVLVDIKEFALTSGVFWVGVISSFIVGLIVIKFLMDYLKKGSFKGFAIYRVVFGLFILALVIIR
ncbi:MAG: undecaprenyl-diphosphate phosphatase [Lachnospiraceae bacterium]|nr:undecaprenyl-diphosphate phosphatase [Lachnospiraceae bacterium]